MHNYTKGVAIRHPEQADIYVIERIDENDANLLHTMNLITQLPKVFSSDEISLSRLQIVQEPELRLFMQNRLRTLRQEKQNLLVQVQAIESHIQMALTMGRLSQMHFNEDDA